MNHASFHSSRSQAPEHRGLGLATLALGCGAIALAGCAHSGRAVGDDEQFPTRIVSPACADAHPPIALELLRVSRDLRPHKPSPGLRHYLVDLRIRGNPVSDQMDLWLLVDEDMFPSAVDAVHSAADEAHAQGVEPEDPRETWWFSGNHSVRAWPSGRASEKSFTNIDVSTGAARIPVTLGTIDVDGRSPKEWNRQTGGRQPSTADEPRARASFEPYCTTWFKLAAAAPPENEAPQ